MPTDPAPLSRNAVFRIGLDALIGGLLACTGSYAVAHNFKGACLVGTIALLKTLQSRLSPDLEKMNRQEAGKL